MNSQTTPIPSSRPFANTLETYLGPWTKAEVRHLLRRTTFGAVGRDVDIFAGQTMNQTLDQVLIFDPEPSPPLNHYNSDELHDPKVAFGQTWIHDLHSENPDITSARVVSMKSWWVERMLRQSSTLHEKLTFFWHNHLATQSWEVFWPNLSYRHYQLLRSSAYGNFRQLVKLITIDPLMLLYLNGAANNRFAPDENYSRELQELFTIGKGPNAQFTESDVQEAARVLTGHTIDWETGSYYFNPDWHDDGDKHFSDFYHQTIIIGKTGEDGRNELDALLDMIFDNNEVALFVVRKLYRFFVYHEISPEVEATVIAPLATIFRDSNYEIMPVLRALFSSAHFYDSSLRGAMIKSPLDFMIGFWRTFGVKMPSQASEQNRDEIRRSMMWSMTNMGLQVLDPPNVAGWPAYHQIPQYDKHWITTNTITNRAVVTDSFIYWGFWSQNILTNVNLLDHIKTFNTQAEPGPLVDDLVELHLGLPVSEQVKNRMVAILLTGQSNASYWTNAWFDYLDDSSNEMKRSIVETRARVLFQYLLQLSEYHLT